MRVTWVAAALVGVALLAGCGETRGQRTATGALGGAVAGQAIADAPLAGAAVGGAIGYTR